MSIQNQSLVEIPFELQLLAHARNYQYWVSRTIQPFLGKRILEVGAGTGNMSQWLPIRERLILTEADPTLFQLLTELAPAEMKANPQVTFSRWRMTESGPGEMEKENLDTIVSFNVLEHVEDDAKALQELASLLRNSRSTGPRRLVTFVPAHQWAFGAMDHKFGHYRRYSARSFRNLARKVAPEAKLTTRYFNLVGLMGWVLTGRILRQSVIHPSSMAIFEKLSPWISPLDDFLHSRLRFPMGQSLLTVLEWPANE
jgi:SAM-dependent methyltransferase